MVLDSRYKHLLVVRTSASPDLRAPTGPMTRQLAVHAYDLVHVSGYIYYILGGRGGLHEGLTKDCRAKTTTLAIPLSLLCNLCFDHR